MSDNYFILMLGWVGIYAPMALGAVASAIGCGIAGQASIGAMLESESGYGRYIGLSAFPSTFVIYGIVIMFTLNRAVDFGVFVFVFALVISANIPGGV